MSAFKLDDVRKQATYNPLDIDDVDTIREDVHPPRYEKQLFPQTTGNFYYCHVNLDQNQVIMTPPDVFSMAFEGGLNLVGLAVALSTYTNMISSGQWVQFLPQYYQTFNSPQKYKKPQTDSFNILATLMGQIAVDMINAGSEIAQAEGGLGVYIPMFIDWLNQLTYAETQGVNILKKVYLSKEFTFIEYGQNDPTYGSVLFNNITYMNKNNDFEPPTSPNFLGTNQNVFRPWLFETYLKPYATAIYDMTVPLNTIYNANGITSSNTSTDILQIKWGSDARHNPIVNGINFTWNISQKRENTNLLLAYSNKPLGSPTQPSVAQQQLFKGNTAIGMFFQAASQFLWQPYITNYLYQTWLLLTKQATQANMQLFPSQITAATQPNFISWQKTNRYYGNALQSTVNVFLQKHLSNLANNTVNPN